MEAVGEQGVGTKMGATIFRALSTTKTGLVGVGGKNIRRLVAVGRSIIFPFSLVAGEEGERCAPLDVH